MNRRDFLSAGRLTSTAGQLFGDVLEAAPIATATEVALLRFARGAMATTFEVVVPFGTPEGHELADAALDEIDRLEAQLTVYRDTSEVVRLNRLAGYTAIRVEDGLFDLLRTSVRIYEESGGAFDITAGTLVKAWGFFKPPRRVPSAQETAAALERVGSCHLQLDPASRTVQYLRPGLEINLGSIGKGYALDRAADLLRCGWNLPAALLQGGQSSAYAIGCLPGDERGWPIGLKHPWEPERRLGTVWVRDRALGTSAATFRHLEHAGRKLGHILDPRTGWPAEGIASATVLAPTAAEADALATAFYIRGTEWASEYCELHPDIAAVLLPDGPDADALTINCAPHAFEPAAPARGSAIRG